SRCVYGYTHSVIAESVFRRLTDLGKQWTFDCSRFSAGLLPSNSNSRYRVAQRRGRMKLDAYRLPVLSSSVRSRQSGIFNSPCTGIRTEEFVFPCESQLVIGNGLTESRHFCISVREGWSEESEFPFQKRVCHILEVGISNVLEIPQPRK
ncbi:hypothetical protein ALC56_02643, partial [Trachymyrmex septentrionalis]